MNFEESWSKILVILLKILFIFSLKIIWSYTQEKLTVEGNDLYWFLSEHVGRPDIEPLEKVVYSGKGTLDQLPFYDYNQLSFKTVQVYNVLKFIVTHVAFWHDFYIIVWVVLL